MRSPEGVREIWLLFLWVLSPRLTNLAGIQLLGNELSARELLRLTGSSQRGVARLARRQLLKFHPWQALLLALRSPEPELLQAWLARFHQRSWLRPPLCLRGELTSAYRSASYLRDSEKDALSFLG